MTSNLIKKIIKKFNIVNIQIFLIKKILMKKITKIPNHIAFILDGNRRWAKKQGKSANFGHQNGANNINNLCDWCLKYNIKYITIYCLSIENLKRSKNELNFLFKLFEQKFTKTKLNQYHKNEVNINIIGDLSVLPKKIQNIIKKINESSINNSKLELQICFGYSGKNEIINATKNLINDINNKNIQIKDIDENLFEKYLYTKNLPNVDLMIRTGGDIRISNFLLWKLSYAELYFCKKYFPAFNEKDFLLALYNFQDRIRRYGK